MRLIRAIHHNDVQRKGRGGKGQPDWFNDGAVLKSMYMGFRFGVTKRSVCIMCTIRSKEGGIYRETFQGHLPEVEMFTGMGSCFRNPFVVFGVMG